MLYVSTRDKNEAFTSHLTLCQDFAPDGGAFVPFRLPLLGEQELLAFRDMTYSQCIADILKRFYPIRESGSDLEFYIGRSPIKIRQLSRRILIAETWHNPDKEYSHTARELFRILCGSSQEAAKPTDWSGIAIRIAALFGVYSELLSLNLIDGLQSVDVSLNADDFSVVIAAWYAKAMGLPIGTVICNCNTSSAVWDLTHHGECNLSSAKAGDADGSLSIGIERLLHGMFGAGEVRRFLQCRQNHSAYTLSEDALASVRSDLFAAVVGDNRIASIITSVYQTGAYRIDPVTAVCYGGLQDYRASTGESRLTLLLSDRAPQEGAAVPNQKQGNTP